MLGVEGWATFLVASGAIWLTPGPDTLFILARTLADGRRAGVLCSLGIGLGLVLHTLLVAVGMSAVLAASPTAYATVKVAGAAYLIYLGLAALGVFALGRPVARGRGADDGNREASPAVVPRASHHFWQGFLTNVFNPKVAVFFLAFLPQFVEPDGNLGPIPFLLLGGVFAVGGTLWNLTVAWAAHRVAAAYRDHANLVPRFQRAAGVIYLALGLSLFFGS